MGVIINSSHLDNMEEYILTILTNTKLNNKSLHRIVVNVKDPNISIQQKEKIKLLVLETAIFNQLIPCKGRLLAKTMFSNVCVHLPFLVFKQ